MTLGSVAIHVQPKDPEVTADYHLEEDFSFGLYV